MRQVILDTETTGLEPELGHRIVEVAGVEIDNRRPSGRHFHRYLNPDRESDEAALRVHGLTSDFLQDKPRFKDIAAEFLDFVSGAELVIHNAAFDIGFLDAELKRAGLEPVRTHCPSVTDSLRLARELHPGKRNSLDALCERYGIDNSSRTLHGALLDAQLLAEVYLAMTRGQESLMIDLPEAPPMAADEVSDGAAGSLDLIVVRASAEEVAAHDALLADIDKESRGACIWKKLEALA